MSSLKNTHHYNTANTSPLGLANTTPYMQESDSSVLSATEPILVLEMVLCGLKAQSIQR